MRFTLAAVIGINVINVGGGRALRSEGMPEALGEARAAGRPGGWSELGGAREATKRRSERYGEAFGDGEGKHMRRRPGEEAHGKAANGEATERRSLVSATRT